MLPETLGGLAVAAGLLGLCVGSFLNVVIHRLPKMMEQDWLAQCAELRGEAAPDQGEALSLAKPRSRCPSCGHQITALENIPLLSYLLILKGKCSGCGTRISPRYPVIELMTGLLSAYAAWHFGPTIQTIGALALLWALIALSAIDLDTQLLPDSITLPLLWLGLLFNISGTIVCSIIFLLFGNQVVDFFMGISGNEAGRMIANANSIIKVCQVLLMLPFTPLLVKATYFIIRGNDEEDKKFELAYISSKHAMSPTTAVLQAVREMERMAQMAETNLIRAMNTLVTRDQKEIDEVYRVEENINFLNKEITNYLVHLNQASLPTSDVMRIGALFHVVNDIERIGDHAENVADSAVQMTNDNVTFSKQGELDLSEMLDMVLKILDESIEMFAKNDLQHLQEIIDIENSIDQEERDLQQKHVERLTRNECTPEAGMIFSDLVSGLERVADHATNIAFSILDEDPEEKAAREAVAGAEK